MHIHTQYMRTKLQVHMCTRRTYTHAYIHEDVCIRECRVAYDNFGEIDETRKTKKDNKTSDYGIIMYACMYVCMKVCI